MRLSLGLGLQSDSTNFDEGILNVTGYLRLEDWAGIHRFRYRLLPRLQQAIHCSAVSRVHDHVRIHEGAIEVAAEINRIGSADVLDYGIEHVESWEFPLRASLSKLVFAPNDCQGSAVSWPV
jgi:hypothetical protein